MGVGAALELEGGTGMCRCHDPLFFSSQSVLPCLSIYHQCATHVPLIYNFCIFCLVFDQNFNSKDANFPNFHSQDPSFFKENLFPRPYTFGNLCGTPTKKKKRVPPPLLHNQAFSHNMGRQIVLEVADDQLQLCNQATD